MLKEGCSSLPLLQFSVSPNTALLCTVACTVRMLSVNSSGFSAVELDRQMGQEEEATHEEHELKLKCCEPQGFDFTCHRLLDFALM